MKKQLVLLLTNDSKVRMQLRQALPRQNAAIILTRTIEDAMATICSRLGELDLVVFDFHDGCRGLTLISAIRSCRSDLLIIVLTWADGYHTASRAYADGASACLAKPTTAEEFQILVDNLRTPKLLLHAA